MFYLFGFHFPMFVCFVDFGCVFLNLFLFVLIVLFSWLSSSVWCFKLTKHGRFYLFSQPVLLKTPVDRDLFGKAFNHQLSLCLSLCPDVFSLIMFVGADLDGFLGDVFSFQEDIAIFTRVQERPENFLGERRLTIEESNDPQNVSNGRTCDSLN